MHLFIYFITFRTNAMQEKYRNHEKIQKIHFCFSYGDACMGVYVCVNLEISISF